MVQTRKPGPLCPDDEGVDIYGYAIGLRRSAPGPLSGQPFTGVDDGSSQRAFRSVIPEEPISPGIATGARAESSVPPGTPTPSPSPMHPGSIDALIATIQRQFPAGGIRITGRGRTVHRQAELMAQRRRANRRDFLRTYVPAPHITEMDQWVANHPNASEADTTTAFQGIIERARANGAVVSNHLSDRARDISIPHGTVEYRNQVRRRLEGMGAHVIDEHDASTGAHWHVDY